MHSTADWMYLSTPSPQPMLKMAVYLPYAHDKAQVDIRTDVPEYGPMTVEKTQSWHVTSSSSAVVDSEMVVYSKLTRLFLYAGGLAFLLSVVCGGAGLLLDNPWWSAGGAAFFTAAAASLCVCLSRAEHDAERSGR